MPERPATCEADLRVFTARPHDNIVQSYGAEFATALAAATAGRVAGAAQQRAACA